MMVFPIIPLGGLIGMGVSALTLWWYGKLTPQQQEAADTKASEYAGRVFQKGVKELASHELHHVLSHVKQGHIGN